MPRSARCTVSTCTVSRRPSRRSWARAPRLTARSEEHTSELQSQSNLVCRLLLEQKNLHPPYGCPRIGPSAKYIYHVDTDAASLVVDLLHGLDRPVDHAWNHLCIARNTRGIVYHP